MARLNKYWKWLAIVTSAGASVLTFSLVGCRPTYHPVLAGTHGVARGAAELEAVLDQPGPVELESIAAADWEVLPTTAWNYALRLAPGEATLKVVERAVGPVPFARENPPVELEVVGRRLPEWQLEDGSAGTLPQSPVISGEKDETLRLIPYGMARLRITAFPRLE